MSLFHRSSSSSSFFLSIDHWMGSAKVYCVWKKTHWYCLKPCQVVCVCCFADSARFIVYSRVCENIKKKSKVYSPPPLFAPHRPVVTFIYSPATVSLLCVQVLGLIYCHLFNVGLLLLLKGIYPSALGF